MGLGIYWILILFSINSSYVMTEYFCVTLDGQMVVMGFVVDVTKRVLSVTKSTWFATYLWGHSNRTPTFPHQALQILSY